MNISRVSGTFLIIGASGAGKTTLIQELCKLYSHSSKIVTYTTRAPRVGEKHMRDYYFCDIEEYENLKNKNFFAECEEVHGAWYGTPRHELENREGKLSFLSVDVKGAITLKALYPHIRVIAVVPPSIDVLRARLHKRGQDTHAKIEERIANAEKEIALIANSSIADLCVMNDDFTELFNTVRKYIERTDVLA